MTDGKLTVGSLFSGIGGLDLGLERAGMEVRWQCEIDPYCRAVLAKHWPGVKCYEDIHDIDDTAERVDLVCGGFPCQPVSDAGKRLAQEDPRWLWPEFARVVGLLRPRFVLVENVPGLTNRGLGVVLGDLSALGYDAEWDIVPASSIGAHHRRERLFVVAYTASIGLEERRLSSLREAGGISDPSRSSWLRFGSGDQDGERRPRVADPHGERQPDASWGEGQAPAGRKVFVAGDVGRGAYEWPPEPQVDRVVDGLPNHMDMLRALGNGVVPQVAEFVGRLIVEAAQCR